MSFGWRPLEGQGRSFISCSWGPIYLRVERRGQQASVKYREEEATSILPFLALASPESVPPPAPTFQILLLGKDGPNRHQTDTE